MNIIVFSTCLEEVLSEASRVSYYTYNILDNNAFDIHICDADDCLMARIVWILLFWCDIYTVASSNCVQCTEKQKKTPGTVNKVLVVTGKRVQKQVSQ